MQSEFCPTQTLSLTLLTPILSLRSVHAVTRVKHVGYLALTLNVMTRNMDVMGHVLDSADRETVRARREAARRQIQEVMESIKPQLRLVFIMYTALRSVIV